MRILAVSDEPSKALWGPEVRRHLAGVDLILSCGDLPPEYLEYLVTLADAPLLYVYGNHDGRRGERAPEGCECVEDRLVSVRGVRVLGLGGSIRYNGEGAHQYTETEMRRRARRQWLALRRSGGIDILLTHAAPLGLGDGTDLAHRGFQVFNDLVERWRPAYVVHGHSHLNYDYKQERTIRCGDTQIVNAYERHIFALDAGAGRTEEGQR